MKTLNNIEIIVSEDNEVSYNYKGTLFTKEQFEEQFLPKSKKYVVIYTDFGDTCDGFARVLKTCDTKEAAMKKMKEDIKTWRKSNTPSLTIDKGDCILYGDEQNGCQWQILEVEM